jgi:hypothetical protein
MSKIILSKSIQELMSKEAMGKTIASVSVSAFSQGPEVYSGVVITGYSITARNDTRGYSSPPVDFDLVGWSNITSSWEVLDSQRNQDIGVAETKMYYVDIPKTYSRFRINVISAKLTSYVNIGELKLYGNYEESLIPNLGSATISGSSYILNGYSISSSSKWDNDHGYGARKAFNGTASDLLDTWNSANGKVTGEWLEVDFGNNLYNYAEIPYRISSQGKQSIPITGSTNTVAVTQSGLQLAQDIAINNTSNTSITHLVFEYTDKFNTKIGYSILPLATPIKSSEKVTFIQPIIPFNTIPNSSTDFELASYYSYTQPVFKDDIILSTSRHALKSFFRNMVDVNTPHTFQTNLTVADNLSGAYGDNRDSLLTSDFTTVPSVNLITMAGVDDTDDLRDTDLTQDKKIFRSKFMNRNFMYVKDHGFYGIKVELDSSVDVSGIQVITQEMNGFTIKLINVTSGYNVYVASTAEPIIRIDGSNIFIYSATKADDLMVAVGDALGELAPFVDRMQELKNVYQNQAAHGDITTKSYTVMIDSTQHVLTTESGVYKSPYGDIPTQILEYNGDTYVQIYNKISPAAITHADYIDSNLNVKLFDSLIPVTDNKIDYIAFRQFKTEMGTVTIVNGKATTPIIEELDDLELSVVFAKVHESQILKGNYSSIVDWRSVSLTNNDIGLYHYNAGEYIPVLDLAVDGLGEKSNEIFYNKNDEYFGFISDEKWSNYFDGNTINYVTVPYVNANFPDITHDTSKNFTIECDVYLTRYLTIQSTIVGTRLNGGAGFELRISSTGYLQIYNTGGAAPITSSVLIPLNKWVKVKAKRDTSTTASLWIDGIQVGSGTFTGANATTNPMRIGGDGVAANQGFSGYISNLKITSDGTTTVLDTCKDSTFKDNSSFNHTLIPTGNVKVYPYMTSYRNQPIAIGNPAQGYFTKYSKEAGKWSNYFGTSSDYVAVAGASSNLAFGIGDFNIDVAFFPTTLVTNTVLFATTGSNTAGFLVLIIQSSKLIVGGYNGSSRPGVASSNNVALNAWNYATISRISGVVTIDLNDIITTGSFPHNCLADTPFIGANPAASATERFVGYISNLKITKAGTVVLDACKDNTFKDNSSFNHTLTPTGNVKVSPFSPYQNSSGYDPKVYGGSGYFENNRYLSIPHSSDFDVAGQDFEIEADVYPTSYATYMSIVAKNYLFYIDGSGKLGYYYAGSGVFVNKLSSVNVAKNCWTNVKMRYSDNIVKLFVNGVEVAITEEFAYTNSSAYDTKIGYAWTGTSYFNGYISNLRMTKNGTEILKMDFDNANIIDGTYGANISEVNATANTTNGIEFAGTASGGSGLTLYPTDNMIYNARTGQFRISCEVNPKSYNFTIFGRYESGLDNDDVIIWCDVNGMISVWFGSLNLNYKSTIPLNLNQWNDVIVERSESGLLAIIINGQVGYMSTITASTVMNATVNWTVGSDNANDELRLNGSIRSLKVEL